LRELLADHLSQTLIQAEEIVSGQARLFGGEPVPLDLTAPGPLLHWTAYEYGDGRVAGRDIKLVWEPARFGWVFPLARVYHLGRDERFAEAFWRHTETFLAGNPINMGPNWTSGQEVALRLIALAFAWQVFHSSPHSTQERALYLGQAIAAHASRIPPTLAYARAQNNNHLLTEAAGLFTASLILPDHPSARRWQELGSKWLNDGLQDQIAEDGTYVQHSANYHRLMLQTALWANVLGMHFSGETQERLGVATRWLLALLDPISGCLPNLGHNDGAYIFPLTDCSYEDHRPVLQAAACAFLGSPAFQPGIWDEMAIWFGLRPDQKESAIEVEIQSTSQPPVIRLESPARDCWAYLRAARFISRPAHADQLHLDLWWRGLNLALDPGTYQYNGAPPWENALRSAQVHNTITVDDRDQMRPAGRFLWLNWAQSEVCQLSYRQDGGLELASAQHDGFRAAGLIHRRTVAFHGDSRLVVQDDLLPASADLSLKDHSFRLHWLLPDWPRESLPEEPVGGYRFRLRSPHGWIELRVVLANSNLPGWKRSQLQARLVRAGENLVGERTAQPYWGWYSPTYAHKQPALSLAFVWNSPAPTSVTSEWSFPS
jgi:hypothetical protein